MAKKVKSKFQVKMMEKRQIQAIAAAHPSKIVQDVARAILENKVDRLDDLARNHHTLNMVYELLDSMYKKSIIDPVLTLIRHKRILKDQVDSYMQKGI